MISEERRAGWRAKANRIKERRAKWRANTHYLKERGVVRFVMFIGVFLYGVPMVVVNSRWKTWEDPETWFPPSAYWTLIYLPAGALFGLVLWKIQTREWRIMGFFSPTQETGSVESEIRASSESGIDRSEATLIRNARVRRVIGWFYVVAMVVFWFTAYLVHPIPGGRIDRWRTGAQHPEPDAVYLGHLDAGGQNDRRTKLMETRRCVSEPSTLPHEGWLCGKPAVWIVHYADKTVHDDGGTSIGRIFWPVCEPHRENVETRYQQRASKERDEAHEAAGGYETVVRRQWTTPPMDYPGLSLWEDSELPVELRR